jgi:hypothetical protein
MIGWFLGQKPEFLSVCNKMHDFARNEERNISSLEKAYGWHGKLEALIRDDKAEKLLEKQLYFQFQKMHLQMEKRNHSLTKGLLAEIVELSSIINEMGDALLELEDSIRKSCFNEASAKRHIISEKCKELLKHIETAEKLDKLLNEIKELPRIVCTVQFINRLRTDVMARQNIATIQDYLANMTEPGWLRRHGEELEHVQKGLYSCPHKEHSPVRIIYRIMEGHIQVCDVLFHGSTYDALLNKRIPPIYEGALQIVLPLEAFLH